MNSLENRINLHRRHCEERRRYLAELESLAGRLRTDGGRLRSEIERAVTVGNPAFAHPLLQRHGQLARALATASRELQRHEFAAAQRAPSAGLSERRRLPRSSRARPAASSLGSADRTG